ncbi:hypothetical protein ACFSJ3_06060 [Corallincola platygyrae]|uniref:Uncharacterized protein n=1 Tax=Corallincola platygyrae TaxID=1193278 RepID=A0ABW4XLA4_9GAMM
MKFSRIYQAVFLLICLCFVTACEEKVRTPEQAALDFFHAIYVANDTDLAASYCLPELAELVKHYHSPHSVKRHIIGFTMDEVELSVSETDADFFRKVATQAEVSIHFKGKVEGFVREDERTVIVVKKGMEWYVQEVKPDMFMTNG